MGELVEPALAAWTCATGVAWTGSGMIIGVGGLDIDAAVIGLNPDPVGVWNEVLKGD